MVYHSVPCQFYIHDDPTEVSPGQTLRLCLGAPRASEHFPLHVSVRFRTAAEVWQIPYAADAASSNVTHPSANRTLCPDLFMPKLHKAQKWPSVEVELTTSSVNNVKVCSPIPKDTTISSSCISSWILSQIRYITSVNTLHLEGIPLP